MIKVRSRGLWRGRGRYNHVIRSAALAQKTGPCSQEWKFWTVREVRFFGSRWTAGGAEWLW